MDRTLIILLFLIVGVFSRFRQAQMRRAQTTAKKESDRQPAKRAKAGRSIRSFDDGKKQGQEATPPPADAPKAYSPHAGGFGEGRALEDAPPSQGFETSETFAGKPVPATRATRRQAAEIQEAVPASPSALWLGEAIRQAVVAQVVLGAPRGRRPWRPARAFSGVGLCQPVNQDQPLG